MVKITHQPLNELVVHELLSISKDDLLRSRVTPQGTMPLFWCDGVLYSFTPLALQGEEVIRDYLKGRLHWTDIQYAKMQEYKPVIALNEEEYKTQMNIRILDTTSIAFHKELIKWLKSNVKI